MLFAQIKKRAHPAEVGSLATVFKKSATEVKQKLLKYKRTIQIATFNVRTLNRIGQQPKHTALAIDYNVDIICIKEDRYTHSEDIKYHDTGNGWTLATGSTCKISVNATIVGRGMLIGPRALRSQSSIEKIQPRMMVVTFMATPGQQLSRATALSIFVKKLNSSSSMMSYPPLFVALRNTSFSSLSET